MATVKGKLKQKTGTSTSDILHPETDASVVVYDDTSTSLNATNAQTAIENLNTKVDNLPVGVTGVKGSAETGGYRDGDVTISAANVGALPRQGDTGLTDTFEVTVTNNGHIGDVKIAPNSTEVFSTDKVILKGGSAEVNRNKVYVGSESDDNRVAVQKDINNVIAVAEGKTRTYIVPDKNLSGIKTDLSKGTSYVKTVDGVNVTNLITSGTYDNLFKNDNFKSDNDIINLGSSESIGYIICAKENDTYTLLGKIGTTISLPHAGDVILYQPVDYPDRWVMSTTSAGVIALALLEARKIDLSAYYTKTDVDTALGDKVDKVSGSSLVPDTKVSSYDTHIAATGANDNPHNITKANVGLGSVVNKGMDNAPTANSENYVKSGGVKTALDAKQDTITATNGITKNGSTISLTASGVTEGDYSAVHVDTYGRVTSGAQMLAVIDKGGSTAGLAQYGWYFEKNE